MTTQSEPEVLVSCVDGVGRIELRRPYRRNAVDTAAARAISAGLRGLSGDPACRVILLAGQGGDLSSGADLKDPVRATPSARGVMLDDIAAAPLPVIAVVDGWAIGTGLGMVGAAAFAVASRTSRFRLPEVHQGFFPHQVVPHLTRRVAPAAVLRWALSGATVDAVDAAGTGLVTTVCDPGTAEATAHALATELAAGPRDVVTAGMRWYHETRTA